MNEGFDYELIPGEKGLGKPLFTSQEEYERWYREFYDAVAPEMEKWERLRALSGHEAFFGRPKKAA